jgi:sigma-E factor negative regulatory protein RseC
MEQEAIVTRVDGQEAIVELGTGAGQGCGRCQEAGGCQSGLLNQVFRLTPRQYRLANSIEAVSGERVILQVAEGAALHAALIAYLMPAGMLIAGALIGASLTDGADFSTALGAVLGLASAIFVSYVAKTLRMGSTPSPVILRRSNGNCFIKEPRE